MTQPNYEFNKEEDALIGNLAEKMRLVGIIFIIVGVMQCVFALLNPTSAGIIAGVVAGVLLVVTGGLLMQAARSFKLIVDTRDHDIANLMDALKSLLQVYNIQFWALILSFVAITGMIIWALMKVR